MDYIDTKFTLDNGKTYLVVEQVNYNGGIYLYISNADDENDTRFVEVKDDRVTNIDPELFEKTIFPLFMEKFRNYE